MDADAKRTITGPPKALTFTVVGTPIAQPRHSVGAGFKGGKPHAYIPAEHAIHGWKLQVKSTAELARPKNWKPLRGPAYLQIIFVMPRPGKMWWKTKPMPREIHTAKPDASNLAKAVEDALLGIAFTDDSQVCRLVVEKWIASGGERPHAEIYVEELP